MTAGRLRNVPPTPDVDIRQIIQEAQNRWLRPMEVCEILRNYKLHNFKLNPVPATTPASGNLFLFDRKALRYFRKDGHNWRKKKDGKTVREAHERLKAGSIDVLHCYYAHGEDNPNFQRRAYWMLDPAFEHIVLVHYREVTENNRSCILRNVLDYSGSERISNSTAVHPQHSQYAQTSTSSVSLATNMASPDTVEMPGTSNSPEPEEVESVDPDELEEAVAEVMGEQAGVQSSLLDQLADRSQVQGLHHQLGPESWHTGSRNTNNLTGAGRQVSAPSFQTQEVFKPAFSDPRNLLHQRGPPRPPFLQNEAVSSISRQFADILDSPGPSYNNLSHQDLQASNSGDIPRWAHGILENGHGNSGHGNGEGSVGKHGYGQSSWEDMLNTVTTPSTRNRLLQGEGLTSSLGQSPLGRDPSHTMGAPTSPKGKGIVDALSPKHLGREPQSALEADLRDVTEKKILKEAEERMQRNRWQPMSELPMVGAANQRMQLQSSSQHMIMPFGELDTLGALVRSGHVPPPDSESSWASNQELPGVQNSYQYDKNALGQQHLQVSPPLQSSLASLDSTGLFSPTIEQILKDVRSEDPSNLDIMESYKKLDSFGRWMNGNDDITDIHPVPSSSSSLWDSGYPEVPQHMDESSILSPSLSEQLFNIVDFSPEWGSSTEETKVIISGSFLKTVNGADQRWCCMFGTVEVPAEVIGEGALRCKAPAQDFLSVPFYITCGDRQACSQVRYFEYRSPANLSNVPGFRSADSSVGVETKEDLLLKIRLSRMLLGHTSVSTNGRNDNKTQTFEENDDDVWKSLENMVHTEEKSLSEVKEELLEVILSHKLEEWLRVKSQMDDGRGPRVLDDRGQGVPHFVAALGYVWSIAQLFVADVPINFRDSSGWTALHWAAKFGREKMVVALIEAGAAAVLISDPTHRYPRGETAADLARTFGHGGIAAFLATKSLTERLSDLTLNDRDLYLNEIDKMSADMEGEQAVAQLARRTSIIRTVQQQEDQEKLRTSLEAVRSSTQAAALIQSVFRQHSLRRRQEEVDCSNVDEYGLSPSEVHSFLAARKIQQAYRGHHQKKVQNLAATRIQQKYRGWKGRREFQTIRQRIIRIQAHVRGRIVRNHFKKIIWSVSIVEKVVLRWLRKRKGLRGFNPSRDLQQAVDDNEDLIKEGREKQKEAVEGDVAIVHSMARQKSDRDQYTRLVEEERRTSASKGELNELNEFMTSSGDYMDP